VNICAEKYTLLRVVALMAPDSTLDISWVITEEEYGANDGREEGRIARMGKNIIRTMILLSH